MTSLSQPPRMHLPRLNRAAVVASGVVALHAGALWALQAGLVRTVTEIVLPVEIVSRFITPPQPVVTPPAPAPAPPPPRAQPRPAPPPPRPAPRPAPALAPAPQPAAIADPTPAPAAPTGVTTPAPAPAPPIAAPVAPAVSSPPPAPPPPPKTELPSSDAAYLQNPTPTYPAMSRRLGEHGKVVVRVLIGADGQPQRAEVKRGSGYPRLDQAALDYVMRCRYVPGKVGGVPQAMWYEAPVNFVLG